MAVAALDFAFAASKSRYRDLPLARELETLNVVECLLAIPASKEVYLIPPAHSTVAEPLL